MIEQRSPEWFAQRVGRITGSRVGAILGCNPFMKPADVMRSMVREFHGAPSEFTGNVATEYGTFQEENALADLELDGFTITEVGFLQHPDFPWLGASPDGLIGKDYILEVKCPYGKRNIKNGEEFKTLNEQDHYYAQVQIEMFCAQREKAIFYQWAVGASVFETVKIDPPWLEENLPKLEAFHTEYLNEIENPSRHLDNIIDNPKLVKQYRDASEAFDEAKAALEEVKEKICKLAGDTKTHISGLVITPVERKGSVDYKKVPELKGVNLEPYRKPPSHYMKISNDNS